MTFNAELPNSGGVNEKILQEGFTRYFIIIGVLIQHLLSSAISAVHYKSWEVPAH